MLCIICMLIQGNVNSLITHQNSTTLQTLTPKLQMVYESLLTFPLGKFLSKNRGLNGKWTSYLIKTTKSENPTEQKLLHAPAVLATRERFGIFQKQIMKHLRPGATVASIPCGVMDDLLTLPQAPEGVSFFGSDLDTESLREVAGGLQKGQKVELLCQDAWKLGIHGRFDIIVSNGLNIYEKDDERVTELYRNFFRALKPGGILITSFLTPKESWHDYNADELAWQKKIFGDVLQVNWQHLRTEATTRAQLTAAGFDVIEIIHDKQGMFPTIVAQAK